MKTNSCSNVPASADVAGAIHHFGFHALLRLTARGCSVLMTVALATASLTALAQNEGSTNASPPDQTATNTVAAETPTPAPTTAGPALVAPTNTVASAPETGVTTGTSTNGLDLNFKNAPIDLVLNYMSDAAGFIVQISGHGVSGYVTVRGKNLTKDEAVDLLNTELIKNGYAAIRNGRRLSIMTREEAVTSGNPVKVINNISDLENNDELITAIIPIRFVEANQLVSELSTFVSSTRIVANQAGNSIVITDTQANIKHLVEIAKAIDSSAEDVTEVRVFHLDNADPTETANLLTGLFQDQGSGAQSPIRFAGQRGGRGGGRGGGFGAFGPFAAFAAAQGGGANSQTERIRQRKQVVAVADPRTSSVVVVATKDLLDQIDEMLRQLDHPGKQVSLVVIPLKNIDASDAMQALQDTVGATTSRNNQNLNNNMFRTRIQQNNQTMGTSTFGTGTGTAGRRGGTSGTGGF